MLLRVVDSLLTVYSLLVIIRIVISFTGAERSPHWSVRAVRKLVDPSLAVARKLVPPIGGTLDVSGFIILVALYVIRQLLLLAAGNQ